jgi:hypothetical protein
MDVLIVPKKRNGDRVTLVRVVFGKKQVVRFFVVYFRPGRGRTPGRWWAASWHFGEGGAAEYGRYPAEAKLTLLEDAMKELTPENHAWAISEEIPPAGRYVVAAKRGEPELVR